MTELRLLASERSAGRRIAVGGRDLEVELATPDAFDGVDIALFSAGGGTSKQLAPEAAARGAAVIDNSSAWRMDPAVPLVVSQVNPDDLAWHEGIIANPNCSTMQLDAAADGPARRGRPRADHRRHLPVGRRDRPQGDRRARGAGQGPRRGPAQGRLASTRTRSRSTPCRTSTCSCDNGYTNEEWKVVTESRKILHLPDLRVSCTAVRVPVFVSHSEAVHVETRDPITPAEARALFAGVKGVVVQDDPAAQRLPAGRRAPPGRTTCSSAGSARTCRSTATAASRSGSCPTTCARARRPTPSRSPRSCSSAAGSGVRAIARPVP